MTFEVNIQVVYYLVMIICSVYVILHNDHKNND